MYLCKFVGNGIKTKRETRMRQQKRSVCIGLWLALGFFTAAKAQQAFYLPEFVTEMALRSEWTLKVGAAVPLGEFRSTMAANGVPQGAATGFSADVMYCYYRTPFFAVGAVAGAQLPGYNFASAITSTYPGTLHTVGWEVYSAGILFQTRVPIVSKLYFLGQLQARYAFMVSPMAWAVESTPILDEKGKQIGTDRSHTDIIYAASNQDFLFGGEVGLQYRIKRNILAQFTVEYRRAVVNNSYKNTRTSVENSEKLQFRYSALMLNLGVTYAFGEAKDNKAY